MEFTDIEQLEFQQDMGMLKEDLSHFRGGLMGAPLFKHAWGMGYNALKNPATIVEHGGRAIMGYTRDFLPQQALFNALMVPSFNFVGGNVTSFGMPGPMGILGKIPKVGNAMNRFVSGPMRFAANFTSELTGMRAIKDVSDVFMGNKTIGSASIVSKMTGYNTKNVSDILSKFSQGQTADDIITGKFNKFIPKYNYIDLDTGMDLSTEGVITDAMKGRAQSYKSGVSKILGAQKTLNAIGKIANTAALLYGVAAAGATAGSLISGIVKVGIDGSYSLQKYAQQMSNKMRNLDFNSGMSTYFTQAAITERTMASQYAQMSQLNGSYNYGRETENL